jgi:hypothetical protein
MVTNKGLEAVSDNVDEPEGGPEQTNERGCPVAQERVNAIRGKRHDEVAKRKEERAKQDGPNLKGRRKSTPL